MSHLETKVSSFLVGVRGYEGWHLAGQLGLPSLSQVEQYLLWCGLHTLAARESV